MLETSERTENILQELLSKGQVRVDLLSQKFKVNTSTIRRDLEKLERQNLLRRIHGGAIPIDSLSYSAYAQDLTFQTNVTRQVEEKSRIGQAAARLIEPGDTIALSPGTTTTNLARALRQLQIPNLTVVTNAINIVMELAGMRGLNLIVTGGILLPDFFALVGPTAEQNLNAMYVNKAFVGVTGFSLEQGLTGPNQLEAITHRLTIQRAKQVFILADHTKLNQVALHYIAPLSVVHTLITDRAAPASVVDTLRTREIEVQMV